MNLIEETRPKVVKSGCCKDDFAEGPVCPVDQVSNAARECNPAITICNLAGDKEISQGNHCRTQRTPADTCNWHDFMECQPHVSRTFSKSVPQSQGHIINNCSCAAASSSLFASPSLVRPSGFDILSKSFKSFHDFISLLLAGSRLCHECQLLAQRLQMLLEVAHLAERNWSRLCSSLYAQVKTVPVLKP